MEYLTVSQYAEKTGKDSGNIRRMLINGRLKGIKLGNQWVIPENSMYPKDARVKTGKYRNWRKKPAIWSAHPELIKAMKKMSGQIAEVYGDILNRVIIYGSYARGEESPESDIDIALILSGTETEQLHDAMVDIVVDYELDQGKTLSVLTIEERDYSLWKDTLPFYRNLDREGVLIWKAQ